MEMIGLWYSGEAPTLEEKKSRSLLHPFMIEGYNGLTINPYQGCGHRCAYCYATYEWSPKFYDKVYAKINAPDVLDRQLAAWKSNTIEPVMVASATDPYQAAELRFELTRKCVQVLQKYNVPYYVFTKSAIIERDLELHRQYRHNCFLVWSITTCNEEIRRIVEPGTPPTRRIFEVVKKFSDAGVCCGVNIDPIMPLITDSDQEIEAIVRTCRDAGLRHVFGALLRLREDIWQRVRLVLRLLGTPDGIDRYMEIYGINERFDSTYIRANSIYEKKITSRLKRIANKYKMITHFPEYMGPRRIDRSCLGQTTLQSYLV